MSTSYFEKNYSLLKKRFPETAKSLVSDEDTSSLSVVVETSKTDDPVPLVVQGERKIWLHSRFDPRREAERFTSSVDPSSFDMVVVMGAAFLYHVEALHERLGPDTQLVIIDRGGPWISSLMENRDITVLLEDPRIHILVDPGQEEFTSFLKGKASRNTTFLFHRGSMQLHREYYEQMHRRIRSSISTRDVNVATLAKFEKLWASNIIRNMPRIMKGPGADIFYNQFTGIPACVVGAGPSLHESIPFLRKNKDRMVLVAVDTAFRILQREEITPHFCLAVDPQVLNARYFEGIAPTDTVLIADPTVHPSVIRLYPGPVALTGIAFEMLQWLTRHGRASGEIRHGGSVSTNASDFARRLGASPVYLVGQDLAFTGGYAHARGSYFEEQVHLRTTRFFTPQMANRNQLRALPPLRVPSLNGGVVETNQKMMIFNEWFGRNNEGLINITAGGAVITGVESGAAEELSPLEISESLGLLVKELYSAADSREVSAAPLASEVAAMREEMEGLVEAIEKGIHHARKLQELALEGKKDPGQVAFLVEKMDATDAAIQGADKVKDLISFTAQRVIHTITGNHDRENLEGMSPEAEAAERSLFLYEGLRDALEFNRRLLQKLQRMVG